MFSYMDFNYQSLLQKSMFASPSFAVEIVNLMFRHSRHPPLRSHEPDNPPIHAASEFGFLMVIRRRFGAGRRNFKATVCHKMATASAVSRAEGRVNTG